MPDGTRTPRQARRNTRDAKVLVLSTWPREGWLAAMWESDQLTPYERLVAVVYARHAFESDVAWVTWPRLARMTGIRAKSTLWKATKGLVAAGWLVQVEKARQHRSPRYRLVVPATDARHTYDDDHEAADVAEMAEYRDSQRFAT